MWDWELTEPERAYLRATPGCDRILAKYDALVERAEAAEIALKELETWCEKCMIAGSPLAERDALRREGV